MNWIVYILECGDGSLYTGITNNMERRLSQHEQGRGAKYTRGRLPLRLVHTESFEEKGDALRREMAIKALGRDEKLALIFRP